MASTSAPPCIVWFRDDLRLSDHPALSAAAKTGAPVICLYAAGAGIALGKTYPAPIVDPRLGRERALQAYAKIRASERTASSL